MKIRSGFVSNSSSSSFIVIEKSSCHENPYCGRDLLVVDRDLGEAKFGWDWNHYYDAGSKIIFSYLQAQYAKRDDYIDMLEEVIRAHTGVKEILWNISVEDKPTNNKEWAYIDHASIGGSNIDMFENKDALLDFLFNIDSYIRTGNDNEEDYD